MVNVACMLLHVRCQVLGALAGLQALAARLTRSPGVTQPGLGPARLLSLLTLNALVLAVACSAFYSFCGNGGVSLAVSGLLGGARMHR